MQTIPTNRSAYRDQNDMPARPPRETGESCDLAEIGSNLKKVCFLPNKVYVPNDYKNEHNYSFAEKLELYLLIGLKHYTENKGSTT
jgi:hypothetical protein